jgi:hypothetical protein
MHDPFFFFHFMFVVFALALLTFSAMNLRHTSMHPIELLITIFQGATGIALASFALFTLMHAANETRSLGYKSKKVTIANSMMEA